MSSSLIVNISIIFCFLCPTLMSQTIISGTWPDTFTGWIYSDSQNGQTDITTIGLLTYHGPYPSFGDESDLEIYTIQQQFYCDKPSSVSLTYNIYFCGTEPADNVELTLNGISYQIGLDIGSDGSSYQDNELKKAVNNECNMWRYLVAGPYSISSVNINELFTVNFQITVNYEPEAIAIGQISIICNPLPTTSPTQTPTTAGTPNPTLSPTADTPSPTLNTASPTTNTASPTLNTASPTAITPSPTSITPAPTSITATPTTNTPSPTSITASPTAITPSPTSITPAPTTVTAGPTSITATPTTNTPSPTSITSGPTTDTPSPTSITSAPTENTVSPTSNTAAPTVITINPTLSPTDNPTASHSPTAYTSNPTQYTTYNPTVSPTNNPMATTTNIQINVPNINVPTESDIPSQKITTTKSATKSATVSNNGSRNNDSVNYLDFYQKLSIILILILIICCMSIAVFIINRHRTKNKKMDEIKEDEEPPQIEGDTVVSVDKKTSQLQTGDASKSNVFSDITPETVSETNVYNDDNNHSDADSDNPDNNIDGISPDPNRDNNTLYNHETPRFPKWSSSTAVKKQTTVLTVYKMEGIMENNDKSAMPADITKGGAHITPNGVGVDNAMSVDDNDDDDDDDAMSVDDGIDNDNNNNYITPNGPNDGGNIAMPMDDNNYITPSGLKTADNKYVNREPKQSADDTYNHAIDEMPVDYVNRSVMTKNNVAMPMDDKYVTAKEQNDIRIAMPMNGNYNHNPLLNDNHNDIKYGKPFNNNIIMPMHSNYNIPNRMNHEYMNNNGMFAASLSMNNNYSNYQHNAQQQNFKNNYGQHINGYVANVHNTQIAKGKLNGNPLLNNGYHAYGDNV